MRFKLVIVHAITAMAGGTVLALVAWVPTSLAMASLHIRSTMQIDAWYGPVIWGPALVLGFLVWRRFRQREAYLVWLVGFVWILAGLHSVKSFDHTWSRVQMDLFPLNDAECSSTEGVYVLFYTWPAICALAYSVGAYVESCWTH